MNKTIIWTIIIYSLILVLIGYIYFNSDLSYKEEIEKIENEYKIKNDSLENTIKHYELKIEKLDSLNNDITYDIDSIKNKQNDDEAYTYTPFRSLSPDSVANIFARYDISERYE